MTKSGCSVERRPRSSWNIIGLTEDARQRGARFLAGPPSHHDELEARACLQQRGTSLQRKVPPPQDLHLGHPLVRLILRNHEQHTPRLRLAMIKDEGSSWEAQLLDGLQSSGKVLD